MGAILIVDDSLTVRMDLKETFEAAGFLAVVCGTLKAARDILASTDVELALLDMRLPDGDGVELLPDLKAFRAGKREIPVIMLSSAADVASRVRGLSLGADEYFGKPYDVATVLTSARGLIHRFASVVPDMAGGSVLVIDDSLTFREELKEAFAAAGQTVHTAITGEEGLQLALAVRPSVIVVDRVLPGIDGPTVVRRVRENSAIRSTSCLLMTASSDRSDELFAFESGVDGFARKEEGPARIVARALAMMRGKTEPDRGSTPSPFTSPRRILAIDDSPTYLAEIAGQLRIDGYDVVCARSGEEGIALLDAQAVDCILLDFMMPGMSGNQACALIKQSPKHRHIPLILLTSLDDEATLIQGINSGADDFITKSGDFDVLRARLRAQLRRKQFEDDNRRVRAEVAQREIDATQARADREIARVREALLVDLERKNEELERARDQALQASQFKSRFLANMSHELRTPLTAIIGFSQLLGGGQFGAMSDTQKEFANNILTSGRHLLELVNGVLDLSKIEAGRLELVVVRTYLAPIFATVRATLSPLAERKSMTLLFDAEDDLEELELDPLRFKQILYNLLSNGVKFGEAGGTVRLSARVHDEVLHLRVQDTGEGIRASDLPRLFQEFERLETSAEVEGTGLGLALTRRLVELHGGTITVESTRGVGTTFTVVIPSQTRGGNRRVVALPRVVTRIP